MIMRSFFLSFFPLVAERQEQEFACIHARLHVIILCLCGLPLVSLSLSLSLTDRELLLLIQQQQQLHQELTETLFSLSSYSCPRKFLVPCRDRHDARRQGSRRSLQAAHR